MELQGFLLRGIEISWEQWGILLELRLSPQLSAGTALPFIRVCLGSRP